MKKENKVIILLVVLILCIIGFALTNYINNKSDEEPSVDFVSVNQSDIVEISWYHGGVDYTINKETGVWHWTGDEDFPVDEDKAENLAKAFADISASRAIEENSEEYGLDSTKIKIEAVMSDGKSYKFTIGKKNELTNENYVMLDGDDKIYMVNNIFAAAFVLSVNDLLKMEDIPEVTDVNKISMAMEGDIVKEYTRSEDGTWTDGTKTLDAAKVTALADKFLKLRWERCDSYNADDAKKSERGFDNPYAVVTISGSNDEEAVFIFAKDQHEVWYVKLDGSNMIYNVNLEILNSINITSEELLPDSTDAAPEAEEVEVSE